MMRNRGVHRARARIVEPAYVGRHRAPDVGIPVIPGKPFEMNVTVPVPPLAEPLVLDVRPLSGALSYDFTGEYRLIGTNA